MATRTATSPAPCFDLESSEWARVRDGIKAAGAWLAAATPGDPIVDDVVAGLVALATHSKWEVRRAVANIAGQHRHAAFEPALAKLRLDDNGQVQQAADAASARRRNWSGASAYGKQNEEHVNDALDGIEARFGVPGRIAVKRASERIADTFARVLYHEIINRVTPLATSAERVRARLDETQVNRAAVVDEVARLEGRIRDLRAILDGMKAYTAEPKLTFTTESITELVTQAAADVCDARTQGATVAIEIHATDGTHLEVCRPRLLQALTNLLRNAIESYVDREKATPVVVTVSTADGHVEVQVRDAGCGMSAEALVDATALFVTTKPYGTGVGLPLVVKIVESEHDGRFRLESVEGRGTTAKIVLPLRSIRAPS